MTYCDDVKPAICSIREFCVADEGATLFERAAGTQLHRDPTSDKCKFLPLGKWRQELAQNDIPTPYMKLTDSLDMVGVKLCATWSLTRAMNGNLIKEKVKKLIGSWRAGKFMALSLRPFSANTYALSLVWFRCSTVNLREGDFASINSSLKSWIYSDMPLKPEEIVLFRPVSQGGLGLASVKHKSMAFLIHNFIQIAANPKYITSIYDKAIFDHYILEEGYYHPTKPPFYSEAFFERIREARNLGHDIIYMTVKEWYNFLLKREIENDEILRPCRVERLCPTARWCDVWRNVRLKALPSETISFSWKLVHCLLPTEERIHATFGNSLATCRFGCPGDPVADLRHCFFFCLLTAEVGSWVLRVVEHLKPGTSVENILRLDIDCSDALIWFMAKVLHYCWQQRISRKRAEAFRCKARLAADRNLMFHQETILAREVDQILTIDI